MKTLRSIAPLQLRGRRGMIALAGAAVIAGLAFNWGWLVAIGLAPVLVAALPCLALCALGLCMSRITGKASIGSAARVLGDASWRGLLSMRFLLGATNNGRHPEGSAGASARAGVSKDARRSSSCSSAKASRDADPELSAAVADAADDQSETIKHRS